MEESASDAIALADRLNWSRFSLIGHSMSGLIVQRMAQLVPDRIERVVAITPVPPTGMGLDSDSVAFMRSIALGGDEERYAAVCSMWGTRLSDTWIRYKLRRWRETAVPVAVAKYVELLGTTQISQESRGFKTPILIVAAAQDAAPFREKALAASMMPFYPNGRLISLGESGHYPMQEQPPLLATTIERYLGA